MKRDLVILQIGVYQGAQCEKGDYNLGKEYITRKMSI